MVSWPQQALAGACEEGSGALLGVGGTAGHGDLLQDAPFPSLGLGAPLTLWRGNSKRDGLDATAL